VAYTDVVVQDSTVTAEPIGPIEAIERFYREQGAKLFRSLYACCGDRDIASDALAEALAQALRRGDALTSPEAWIWRVAFRLAAAELQRRRRNAATSPPERGYVMEDPVVDLVRALARLAPKQRAVAVLSLYADLSTRDVARIMGIAPATVRVHLTQARRRLRTLLEDDDG
jgi:RNA polymerase sigma factor (sigma-70 family)